MVKPVDGREFNNVAEFRCLYEATVWRISIQGLVCSPRMVVIEIRGQESLEMPLVEHDHVVDKFSTYCPDYAFRIGILPWRRRCGDDLVSTQTFDLPRNALTVDAVAVSNQITRRGIKRKRLDQLLCCPLRRRMFGHVEVNNSPSIVGKHNENEQHPKHSRRDDEKVDRYEISNMLV